MSCTKDPVNSALFLTMLQISDTAFPTGGYSHSVGFESAHKHLIIKDKESYREFVKASLENAGSQSLAVVRDAFIAHEDLILLAKLDALCQTCLINHVTNRASVRQGHSIIDTAAKTFTDEPGVCVLQTAIREGRLKHGHLAVMLGALCGRLGLPLDATLNIFMFTTLKTIIASSVRLGAIGPLEAQGVQYRIQQLVPNIIERNLHTPCEAVHVCFPLVDVVQNVHDTMFSKMFYS